MIRLGFLGIESKHAEYFASIFNQKKYFTGVRVTTLWAGDAPEKAGYITKEFGIDKVAKTSSELIDEVDAMLILLRNGEQHMEYAVQALQKRKPLFVDKPFTFSKEHAHTIVNMAQKTGTPLFAGSTLRHLPIIHYIKKFISENNVSHVSIRYSADALSPYGGYYFYGSHLAELCTALCGKDFTNIKAIRRESDVCAIVEYPKLIAILNSSPDVKNLEISVSGSMSQYFSIDESDCYYSGMKVFVNMLETGLSQLEYDDLVRPVEMLSAIVDCFSI